MSTGRTLVKGTTATIDNSGFRTNQ